MRPEFGGLVKDRKQLGELKELKELRSLMKVNDCGGLDNKNCQGSGNEHLGGNGMEANVDRFGLFSRVSSIFPNNNDERWVDFCAGQQVELFE